ncbi:MAG: hypothetical protein HYY06_33115 [Deltaproteobacteria bacterium]|nr:hypothetical protein [Deltaproteobacteria bacterium]
MRTSRAKAAAVILLVFLLGGVTGAALTRWVVARKLSELLESDPVTVRQRVILFALDRKLDLSDDQRSRIRRILAAQRPEFAAVARKLDAELRPLRTRTASRIREVLEQKQRRRFDLLMERLETKLRRFEAGSGHGSK